MDSVKPYFGVFWGAREQKFGEFVNRTHEFLISLRELHPLFDTLYVLGGRADAEEPLGHDLEHLEDLAFERGWDKKAPKHWFTHLDDEGRPTRETLVRVGWRLSVVNMPESAKTSDFLSLSISSGQSSKLSSNSVVLAVNDPESPLLDPELSEILFRHLIDFWQPDEGWLTEAHYRDAVWDDSTREQLGWLNYRADPSFAQFLPPAVSTKMQGQGLIFRIGDGHVLSADDHDEIATAQAIQAEIQAEQ